MDLAEAIRLRKSIRAFKPDPVPKEVLWKILEISTRAPSGTNKQPWEITVVAGEVLDNIKRDNLVMLAADPVTGYRRRLEGVYRRRQVELAIQLFQLMGIVREDKEKRAAWRERGFRFFDAPAAIYLAADDSLEESRVLLDIGLLTGNICLLALDYGLGTCIEGQGVTYPEVVRKYTGIPESKRLITSIAIGYPDWDFPANKVVSTREPLENVTTWLGFGEDGIGNSNPESSAANAGAAH